MSVKFSMVEEFSFSDEESIGIACAGALRRVRNLADELPLGRLFASIATLAESAGDINRSLEAGNLVSAGRLMRNFAEPTSLADTTEPLPTHFKRRT